MMRNANSYFGSSNGTENYFRHPLTKFIFTDGVKNLADACQAYWLIDLILSHQLNPKLKSEPFQVWNLQRVEEDQFHIRCHDGNDNHLAEQQIPFSDFPYDQATVWLVDGVLLLPCEY